MKSIYFSKHEITDVARGSWFPLCFWLHCLADKYIIMLKQFTFKTWNHNEITDVESGSRLSTLYVRSISVWLYLSDITNRQIQVEREGVISY